jgi:predicted lactoylglutathione lyase
MEQRISLVTLGVNDLGKARVFYESLGWVGACQPDDEVCFFQAGGMVSRPAMMSFGVPSSGLRTSTLPL